MRLQSKLAGTDGSPIKMFDDPRVATLAANSWGDKVIQWTQDQKAAGKDPNAGIRQFMEDSFQQQIKTSFDTYGVQAGAGSGSQGYSGRSTTLSPDDINFLKSHRSEPTNPDVLRVLSKYAPAALRTAGFPAFANSIRPDMNVFATAGLEVKPADIQFLLKNQYNPNNPAVQAVVKQYSRQALRASGFEDLMR